MVITIVSIIIFAVLLYLSIVSFYLFILTLASYAFKKRVRVGGDNMKICIVIPAHNEEKDITCTLNRLKNISYPEAQYDIVVIADNCDDRTADLARAGGAKVFERTDTQNMSKGHALDWFFIHNKEILILFDIIVIMDADTLMDENYLKEISFSFNYPQVKVVQGCNGVFNAEKNWRTALTFAAFSAIDHIRPAGHNVIGGSAGLRGNGMAFRADILEEYGWPTKSIVEDAEFSLVLLLDGIIVDYNPDAIVLSHMPTDSQSAEIQRSRWEGARNDIFKKYTLRLLKAFIHTWQIRYFWSLMEILTPPLSTIVMGMVALGVIGGFIIGKSIVIISSVGLFVLVFYVFSGLVQRKAKLKIWIYLISSPVFIIWKIKVYIKMAFDKNRSKWQRTPRQ